MRTGCVKVIIALKHLNMLSINHFYQGCLLFMLAIGLLSWAGCEPVDDETPPVECAADDLPQVNYSNYCTPDYRIFSGLGAPEFQAVGLPDFCATDYTNSRSAQLEVPAAGRIYFHRYVDFPAAVGVEFIGTNCMGENDYTLIDCSVSSRIFESYAIEAANYTTVIVRIVYVPNSEYVPGTREEDVIELAAFTQPYTPAVNYNDGGNGQERVPADCFGRPFSFILSPSGNGVSPVEDAIRLGFPYEVCNCDADIVKVELPEGVDLNAVRPKVPKSKTESDTTEFSFNLPIGVPIVDFLNSEFNPALDPNVGGNPCLDFEEPTVSSGNFGLRVAIIDSGVDFASLPEIFGPTSDNTPDVDCIAHGAYGYDFIGNDSDPDDISGHGTLVATAYLSGLSSQFPVTLVNYKFLDSQVGTLFNAMCATSTAITFGADIINMSWGFGNDRFPPVLKGLLDRALNENILIVTSAGNEGRNVMESPTYWPAAAGDMYSNVIAVGSYAPNNENAPIRTPFSNFSEQSVEVAAIYSTQTLSVGGATVYPAGTSISAPIVSRKLTATSTPGGDPAAAINLLFNDANQTATDPISLPQINSGRYLRLPTPENGCGSLQ